MTVGEMLQWTKRFNQILGGARCLRDKRLAQLMTDLERAYNIPISNDEEYNQKNPFVIQLYRAVAEARNGNGWKSNCPWMRRLRTFGMLIGIDRKEVMTAG